MSLACLQREYEGITVALANELDTPASAPDTGMGKWR